MMTITAEQWDSLVPGSPCLSSIDDIADCTFTWLARSDEGRQHVVSCTRPLKGHAGHQHVAEGADRVEAVYPWHK